MKTKTKTKTASKPKPATVKEVSAGGVVLRDGAILIVKVENLQGRVVWTFPKGHLEKGETAEQAALREVREETGWQCRLKKRIGKAQYRFQHEGRRVFKTVHWFSMDPVAREGEPDPVEILDARWCSLADAEDLLVYDSDKAIMAKLKKA